MKLYRFSPIRNKKKLNEAVKYVATQNTKLCKKIIGKPLPITSLTIFAHYHAEYEEIVEILSKIGKYYNENNGIRVTLHNPIKVGRNTITHLRIRRPDPYRMHVGCSDLNIKNYSSFKKKYLDNKSKNLRLIVRSEYEMIEFFDPDFDILAYVVSNKIG